VKLLIAISQLAFKGGGEKVVLNIAKHMSKNHKVTLLTANYDEKGTYEDFQKFNIKNLNIKTKSFVFRQILMLLKFSRLKLKGYDVINVHDFPATALSLRNENTIWYCHTPPRIFYDLRDYYLRKVNVLLRPFAMLYVTFMRMINQRIVKKIHTIVVNSKNVQERVEKYYKRKSEIIYPGISVVKICKSKFKKFLLSVSRLYPEKRVHLAVKAMKHLPDYKLFIVGNGPAKKVIEEIIAENKLNNVVLLSDVSEQKLRELYHNCFAVVYVPVNEDFGLIPIEANAHGKMVVGANEGGLKETVIHGKTGILINNPTPAKIVRAIRKIERINPKKQVAECVLQAKKFTWSNFNKRMEQIFLEKSKFNI